jgi:hypothetical protein
VDFPAGGATRGERRSGPAGVRRRGPSAVVPAPRATGRRRERGRKARGTRPLQLPGFSTSRAARRPQGGVGPGAQECGRALLGAGAGAGERERLRARRGAGGAGRALHLDPGMAPASSAVDTPPARQAPKQRRPPAISPLHPGNRPRPCALLPWPLRRLRSSCSVRARWPRRRLAKHLNPTLTFPIPGQREVVTCDVYPGLN